MTAWKVTADPERFDEAVAHFLALIPLTAEQAAELDEDIQERAFWIGAGLDLHQVQSVFDEIATAIDSGEPFEDWRARVRDTLTSDAHSETVFRNAVQKSYNAGRYRQMTEPDVAKFRPYFMYDSVLDSRTSSACRTRNGTLLPQSDPFWQSNWPPNHHNCRAGVRSLRKAEAERRGITPEAPDVEPTEGWGKAPTADPVWKPDPAKLDKKLGAELKRKAKDKPVPVPTLTSLVGK
ncbi:MAG TPA: phage minor head protein [Polyangiaceae bacterium]|nr:phage minor head protein [Polyangiaceae bacterium]